MCSSDLDVGQGGVSYGAATSVTWRDGEGVLRVHPVLPRLRDVVVRGGPQWDFWTPGDDHGGAWGSGQNWPLEPFAGGPLPSDPFLLRMWKTFWGPTLDRLEPSNSVHVVPGGWRMEVSPTEPALDDRFLHLIEISDRNSPRLTRVEPLEGHRLSGVLVGGPAAASPAGSATAGNATAGRATAADAAEASPLARSTVLLFAVDPQPALDGEVTLSALSSASASASATATFADVYIAGLRPNARYDLQWTTLGIPKGRATESADEGGVLHALLTGAPADRLRIRRID